MKNKLLLCSHGNFALEIKRSAEMIIGPMEDAIAVCLQPGMSGDDFVEALRKQLDAFSQENVFLIADLFGGTPCNCAARLLKEYPIQIVTGLNLGMLLEVYSNLQQVDRQALKQIALQALQLSCVDVNEKLGF